MLWSKIGEPAVSGILIAILLDYVGVESFSRQWWTLLVLMVLWLSVVRISAASNADEDW